MTSLELLRNISKQNNGIILTKSVAEYGVSRATLSYLCKEGRIVRVSSGQYVLADEIGDEMLSLHLRSSMLVFSHESALFLNGISERTPFEHTVTIPTGKTLSRSISSQCKIYYIKDELFDIGRVQLKTPMGNKVFAYDMDRTVCDIVRSKSRIADETFAAALKNYAVSPNKNLVNLSRYADAMGITSQIKKYLEVLL